MGPVLGFVIIVAAFANLAPYLTRRDIFFGVTVDPGFRDTPVARRVARRYAFEVWALAAVICLLVATSTSPELSAPVALTQTLGASVAFAIARSTVLPHAAVPSAVREAEIAPPPSLPGGLLAQAGPFLILLASAVYLGLHWDDIPGRFPTHWNLAGRPNGWTDKSVVGVFRGVWFGLVACGASCAISLAVLHRARLPRVSGEDGRHSRRVRQVNLLTLLASSYTVALLLGWTSIGATFANDTEGRQLPLLLRIAPFAIGIIGTMTVIRLRVNARLARGAPIGDTTPDANWLLGQIYFNRADPAILVEKRMGLGYTLNLGNARAWLALLVFVGAITLPLFLGA
jgi:uncharacterized membrane protein